MRFSRWRSALARQHVLIVGGGVIGLSVAWELNRRGLQTTVVDQNEFGTKASWAGAGILAPANFQTMTQPLDRLKAYGSNLHSTWSQTLFQLTGVDNGYRRCGGLYVARTAGEQAALLGQIDEWIDYQIDHQVVDPQQLSIRLARRPMTCVSVPEESQIDNRLHLQALQIACRKSGSRLLAQCGRIEPVFHGSRCKSMLAVERDEEWKIDQVVICVGAWSSLFLERMGVVLPVIPVRGQMALYKLEQMMFEPILNEGSRYIVPRTDGHVLVGSTTEEAGFDETTTESGMTELTTFASDWISELSSERLVTSWAGLRPASHDGFPYMGQLNELENVWVATGHFKAGLQVSPAVAEIMADQLQGTPPQMETQPFAPSRLNVDA